MTLYASIRVLTEQSSQCGSSLDPEMGIVGDSFTMVLAADTIIDRDQINIASVAAIARCMITHYDSVVRRHMVSSLVRIVDKFPLQKCLCVNMLMLCIYDEDAFTRAFLMETLHVSKIDEVRDVAEVLVNDDDTNVARYAAQIIDLYHQIDLSK